MEETAEAAVGGGIMEKRVLLVFDRVEGLCRAHPLCRPGVQIPKRRNYLLKAIQGIPCRTPDIYAPIAYHRDARLGSASSLGFSNPGTRTSTPFFSSSRRLHAEFAAERDWGQFHQPRNTPTDRRDHLPQTGQQALQEHSRVRPPWTGSPIPNPHLEEPALQQQAR